jgi:PAS domain S-box-containing protein
MVGTRQGVQFDARAARTKGVSVSSLAMAEDLMVQGAGSDEDGGGRGATRVDAGAPGRAALSGPDSELFALLVGSVVDYAIFVLDPGGRVATWNLGAERIKGYRADEIIGQHFSRFYEPHEVAAGKPANELVVAAAEGRFEDEGWRLRRDGSRFWANVVITALRDATGELRGFAKVTRDLTERKGAEDRAVLLAAEQAARVVSERLRSEAEAANRAKDEFLAMLSHELRNPLAPMVTALALMKLRAPDVGQQEREVIERQVRHLTLLIEDLLDISRITQGKVSLHRSRTRLDAAVTRAIELAEPILEQRRQHLELDLASDLEVDGDPERLAQVFTNLLANAAKYTPDGGRITVRGARDGDDQIVTVTDDGEGISAELLPRVFDLFTQATQSLDRSRGGLGLGLAIARGLVTLHGGTVTAASEGPGRGSTFTVRLPAARPDAARTGDTPAARAGKRAAGARRILIVDDNGDAATMLGAFFHALGHEVEIAHDGPRALDIASKFAPQIGFLDIGLPLMDGYELARLLRATPGLDSVFLVAITGYGRDKDRARALAAGFQEHFVKPVDVGLLRQLVQSLMPGGSGGRASPA